MLIRKKFNEIIRDSLGEVSGGYFAKKTLWKSLGTDNGELNKLFYFFDKQDTNRLDSEISMQDFHLILRCIEVTLKELGEEDMHIHTGIEWDEANKLYEELKTLASKIR